jgi:hypothetical protein
MLAFFQSFDCAQYPRTSAKRMKAPKERSGCVSLAANWRGMMAFARRKLAMQWRLICPREIDHAARRHGDTAQQIMPIRSQGIGKTSVPIPAPPADESVTPWLGRHACAHRRYR